MGKYPEDIQKRIQYILKQQEHIPEETLLQALSHMDPMEQRAFLHQIEQQIPKKDTDETLQIYREDWYGNALLAIMQLLKNIEDGVLTKKDAQQYDVPYLRDITLLEPRHYYKADDVPFKRIAEFAHWQDQMPQDPQLIEKKFFPPELQAYTKDILQRIDQEVLQGRSIDELLQAKNLLGEISTLQLIIEEAKSMSSMHDIYEWKQEQDAERAQEFRMRRVA